MLKSILGPMFDSKFGLRKCVGTLGLVWAIGLSVAIIGNSVAHAAPKIGEEPGGHLLIREVHVDYEPFIAGIVITLENFDIANPDDLVVTLGELGNITDRCFFPNLPELIIFCEFIVDAVDGVPDLPEDGDYLLSVASSGGQSEVATYDLTIVAPVAPSHTHFTNIIGFYSVTSGPHILVAGTPRTEASLCNDNDDVATGGGYRLENVGGGPPLANATSVLTSEPLGWAWVVTAMAQIDDPTVSLFVTVVCAAIDGDGGGGGGGIPPLPFP